MRTYIDDNGIAWAEPEQAGIQAMRIPRGDIQVGELSDKGHNPGRIHPQIWLHDSIVVDLPAAEADTTVDFVTQLMEAMCGKTTQLPTDIEIGWGKRSWETGQPLKS